MSFLRRWFKPRHIMLIVLSTPAYAQTGGDSSSRLGRDPGDSSSRLGIDPGDSSTRLGQERGDSSTRLNGAVSTFDEEEETTAPAPTTPPGTLRSGEQAPGTIPYGGDTRNRPDLLNNRPPGE